MKGAECRTQGGAMSTVKQTKNKDTDMSGSDKDKGIKLWYTTCMKSGS